MACFFTVYMACFLTKKTGLLFNPKNIPAGEVNEVVGIFAKKKKRGAFFTIKTHLHGESHEVVG